MMGKDPDVELRLLKEEDLKEVLALLLSSYFTREPQHRGLKTSCSDLVEDVKPHIRACLASGVSVGARRKDTGELVGLRLSLVVTREPTQNVLPVNFNTESASHEAAIASGCQVVYTVVLNSNLQRPLEQNGYKILHTRELGRLKYQGGPQLHLDEMGDSLTIRAYVKDLPTAVRCQSQL
ncbi:uncharacterized protein LOC122264607 [Penaeus japonicus]|uniref:uncharacterized protein LOC122264607 n=1 Tax=Penaeus japonicus TaxID=27405 RepID=UPI001C715C51|nr:uncharacterized protein LOC122264607 [Penaeus japonicus]XP_042889536.1 uncharacterized protein LOC122264607 [Penaeus japonicus]XP_042889537.1 uncharacterized protein LOC122264607 [Penaeus japonicus]XP_042889538.1 uncharacterized protein LOC122264607 [Penaeus japonicus]